MFGRKKVPKEDNQQPKARKGNALMAQLGLGNDLGTMEDMIYGNDDDDDLEAELAALQSDSSPENKPAPKSKPIDLDAIMKLAKRGVDDDDDDDDDDITEAEESGLLAELDILTDERDEPIPSQSTVNESPANMTMLVEDRLAMYQIAIQNANQVGDVNKVRRLTRGLKTLEDQLKMARSGKTVHSDDLPPAVALGSSAPTVPTAAPTITPTITPTISTIAAPTKNVYKQVSPTPPENRGHVAVRPTYKPQTVASKPQAPTKPIPAVPSSKPKIELNRPVSKDPNYVPGSEFVEGNDKETHAMLYHRRLQYKQAALVAKRGGDVVLATSYVRTAKQFDGVILALEEGKPIDLSKMPPPPPSNQPPLQSLGAAAAVAVTNEVSPRVARDVHQGLPADTESPRTTQEVAEDRALFHAPDAPKTVLEALNQRLDKYKCAEEDANKEGNTSKARRMGRIVKQYVDSIKAQQAGRPVDYDSLPTPPGFGPIPLAATHRASTLPVLSTQRPPTIKATPTASPIPVTLAKTYQTNSASSTSLSSQSHPQSPVSIHPVSPTQSTYSQTSHVLPARLDPGPKKTSMRQEQHLMFLRGRMKEFKVAAIQAKKNDDIELAKKYFRFAKGCEPMIHAAESGLPVDLSQVPEAPLADDDDGKFVVMAAEEFQVTGDRDEMYQKLEHSLIHQIELSVTNAQHYTKLGDIPMASRFKKYEQISRKDLDSLKSGRIHGNPVPRFHYETRSFSMVRCNTDLGENDMELSVERGLQYNPPSGYTPDDMTTYVKYEFAFPSDNIQVGSTESYKRSCDPQYNETFKLQINKKSRAFARVVERKGVKIEVFFKRGFLKSDKILGTVNVSLQPLETACTLHETYDLMEGKKAIGGKLVLKIRIRDALKNKEVEEMKEMWLVIDAFIKTASDSPKSVSSVASKVKKSKSEGSSSIEVMRFEKQQLDKQISFLKSSLSPTQLQTLSHKSKLIQEKIERQQKSLKDGGLPTLRAYAAQVESELQPIEDEARVLAKQGDMQKAQTLLSKKREALRELNAINAKLKIMS